MSVFSRISHLSRFAACTLALSAAGAATASAAAAAAAAPEAPSTELSGPISVKLGDLSDFQSKNDPVGALKLVNQLLGQAKIPYDSYFLNNLKWQFTLQDDKNPNATNEALAPLQEALKLADQYKFADQQEMERLLQTGSQLVFQVAQNRTGPEKVNGYKQAAAMMKRYLEGARNFGPQDIRFYAAIVMQIYGDPDTPKGPERDALLEEAIKSATVGAQSWPNQPGGSLKPSEDFYVILLTAYLAQEKYDKATSILEYLVNENPKDPKYWEQLTQVYVTLAFQEDQKPANEKDANKVFSLNMRALATYDRAQALGFLKAPKDNEMIVGIYGSLNQYGYAAERLEKELRSGGIESKEDKWQNAALYYQLDGKYDKAVQLLKFASTKFPNSGTLDYVAATAYAQMDDSKNSYEMAVSSAKKGVGDKTWRSWALAAYKAYDLERLDDALNAVDEALKDPNAAKEDPNLQKMRAVIVQSLEDKKRQKEAIDQMVNKK